MNFSFIPVTRTIDYCKQERERGRESERKKREKERRERKKEERERKKRVKERREREEKKKSEISLPRFLRVTRNTRRRD